ncbi:MAG: MFS transporter [archaeon]|nr:MFS transporter [archaeon]
MFFKKDELKLLWPFYLDSLFVTIFFVFPAFYILYFLQIGLSLTQIGLLMSSFGIAALFFEIPTGIFADVYGRKFSTVLGFFLSGITIISVNFFQDFNTLFVLFFLWGVSGTLISGADEAWVVDLLHHKKRKDIIHEYFSKKHSLLNAGFLLSGIVGALFVKEYGLGIIWFVSGISFLITSIVLLFGEEHFVKKKLHIKFKFFNNTKDAIKYSIRNKAVLLIMFATIIFAFVSFFAGDITWYPFLQELGLKDYWFGYLFSATCFLGIFIPYFTKFLIGKFGGYKKYLLIVFSLMAIILFAVGFTKILILVLLIYLLFNAIGDFFIPVDKVFFQKFIPTKMRATLVSFKGMAYSVGGIIAPPVAGFIADKIGPQYTIVFASFFIIPIIILYSRIKEK